MWSNDSLKSALKAVESVAGAIVLQLDVTPALGTRLKIDHPRTPLAIGLGALHVYERPYRV